MDSKEFFPHYEDPTHHLTIVMPDIPSLVDGSPTLSPVVRQVNAMKLEPGQAQILNGPPTLDGPPTLESFPLSWDSDVAGKMGKRKRLYPTGEPNFVKRGSRTDGEEDLPGDELANLMDSASPNSFDDSPPSSPPCDARASISDDCNGKVPQFRNLSGPNRDAIRQKATSFLVSNWPVNKVSSLIQKQFNCRVSQRTLYNWKSQALCGKTCAAPEHATDCPQSPLADLLEEPKSHADFNEGPSHRVPQAHDSLIPAFQDESLAYSSCPTSPSDESDCGTNSSCSSPQSEPSPQPDYNIGPCHGAPLPFNADLFSSEFDAAAVAVKLETPNNPLESHVRNRDTVSCSRSGSLDLSFACQSSPSLMMPPVSPVLGSFTAGFSFVPGMCL